MAKRFGGDAVLLAKILLAKIHNGMGGAGGGGSGGGGGGEGGKVDEGEERCVVVRCIRIYEVSSSHRSRHLAAQRWRRRAI